MRAVALDFETEAIEGHRPPKPVGLAVAHSVAKGRYLGWGHPGRNNAEPGEARRLLGSLQRGGAQLWCFNSGFDVPAARAWGVPIPWSQVQDAQILAFLGNPLAPKRGLKALCESELGIKPDERSALWAWIRANIPEARRLKDTGKLGAFIARAPCDLVAPYASRDATLVLALRGHWRSLVGSPAWDREHAVLPILDAMRERGIPIARRRLARDAVVWEGWLADSERWLKRYLGVRDLKPAQVVPALEKLGVVDEWIETPEGGVSLAREALTQLEADGKLRAPEFVQVWGYRAYLAWMIRTFVRPWLASEEEFLHPTWNGVLQEKGGAVTGRLSSRPNVQNLPKLEKVPAFKLPSDLRVGPIPNLREYFEAPPGFTFVGVDISQQELRILGHFVPSIGDWYRENPRLDLHTRVRDLIRSVSGTELSRDIVKVVNFCTIYGGGANAISEQGGIPYGDARSFKRLHADALPGIARWDFEMHKQPRFATAGGRWYTPVDGKEYRDRNYAIQGSAADQLKDLMIVVAPIAEALGGWLCLTAHDELLTCVPRERAKEMRAAMERAVAATGVGGEREMFSIPMIGETYGGKRWRK